MVAAPPLFRPVEPLKNKLYEQYKEIARAKVQMSVLRRALKPEYMGVLLSLACSLYPALLRAGSAKSPYNSQLNRPKL